MNVDEYQDAVIQLFRSGHATDAQWREMASAVLQASESEWEAVPAIDAAIDAAKAVGGEDDVP